MNPRLHDEFVALCALFYSGELSEEDWALLQVHMAYCDSCRQTFEEFKLVAREVVPAMAGAAAAEVNVPSESPAGFEDAGRRLMSRVNTAPRSEESPTTKKKPWRVYGGALAACALVLLAFANGLILGRKANPPERAASPVIVPQASPTAVQQVPANDDHAALKRSQDEIVQLHLQIEDLQKNSKNAGATALALQQQLQTEQAQRQQLASQKDALAQQLDSAQSAAQGLRDQLGSAQAGSGQQATQIAALETKVHNLSGALEEANNALDSKERMLALDKDFLAHDRDIRDLIGARNLYIADIYDTTESGKTAKPFGRIFYTQDRSLVFYGFDLEKQAGLPHSVAFQAWGTGTDRKPVSLGLFYQDDSHKRWVVRCDDAKTLARLNMVFVTIEPPGGSSKPTGKQLLRAYLQIQPNHP